MRLGSHVKPLVKGNLEEWEAERLTQRRGKDVERVQDGNEGLYGLVTELELMVDERANNVVVKAQKQGEDVKVVGVCCHKPNCGLCLGRYPSHKPQFYAQAQKVKDVPSFLSRFIEGEEVVSFLRICEVRDQALVLFNYQQKLLVRLRLLEEEEGK